MRRTTGTKGHTLTELSVAVTLIMILASMAVPSFERAVEASRLDVATANLHAIAAAQRIHWLERRAFAPGLQELAEMELLSPALARGQDAHYAYSIRRADESGFAAVAERINGGSWIGSITINERGEIRGAIFRYNDHPLRPAQEVQE